jgi:methionine aminotransferase
MDIDSKLPKIGTNIFSVMSQLANESNAINLAQGFPSFDPPNELLERITYHLNDGANQYAPMPGVPALRNAIAEMTQRLQGRSLNADAEITVSTGATEGLFSVIQAVVRRGDEVIVFDPAYDSYEPAVSLAGGITRHVPLAIDRSDGDFNVDWQLLSDTMSDKTRLIICNFPHNPTGAILSSEDLDQLAAIVRDSNSFLLSDEVYEHIVFDGAKHLSLASHDELWERSFVISSFGKTFHATGWKVGYCLAPENLTAEFRRIHQFTTFTVVTPIQHALADFMASNPEFPQHLSAFYQQKRDLFCELLEGSRFRFKPARSTFFQMLDYGDVSQEPDAIVAKKWTREIGVASIPISVFCEKAFSGQRLRFCFAKDDATLASAVDKLRSL